MSPTQPTPCHKETSWWEPKCVRTQVHSRKGRHSEYTGGKNSLLVPPSILHLQWECAQLLYIVQPLGIWCLPTTEEQTEPINTSGRLVYFYFSERFLDPLWRCPWDISTNTMKGETTHSRFVKPGSHIQKEISLPNSTAISKQYNIY